MDLSSIKSFAKRIIPNALLQNYSDYKKNKAYKATKAYQFRGDKVYCLICGAKFNSFGPYGLVERQNAYCFNCGSLERHRALWKFLNEETSILDGTPKRLLHIAPEKILYKKFIENPNIEYFPGDLFPENSQHLKKTPVIKTDITNLVYTDNYFGVIICNHVLEHVPQDRKAMSEFYRVLKSGGIGIFMIPINYHPKPTGYDEYQTYEDWDITSDKDRRIAFGQEDHVRVYGTDFKDRLESVGFEYNELDYLKILPPDVAYRLGFANSWDLVPYCIKPKD